LTRETCNFIGYRRIRSNYLSSLACVEPTPLCGPQLCPHVLHGSCGFLSSHHSTMATVRPINLFCSEQSWFNAFNLRFVLRWRALLTVPIQLGARVVQGDWVVTRVGVLKCPPYLIGNLRCVRLDFGHESIGVPRFYRDSAILVQVEWERIQCTLHLHCRESRDMPQAQFIEHIGIVER
jgi:hypothetical protein